MSGVITLLKNAKTGKEMVIGAAKLMAMTGEILCTTQSLVDVCENQKRKKAEQDEN